MTVEHFDAESYELHVMVNGLKRHFYSGFSAVDRIDPARVEGILNFVLPLLKTERRIETDSGDVYYVRVIPAQICKTCDGTGDTPWWEGKSDG